MAKRIPSRTRTQKPIERDFGKIRAAREALAPSHTFSLKELPQYEAVVLMRNFVSCFSFEKIDGQQRASLGVRPSDMELEAIAERFRQYLRTTKTLDEAFGLKGIRRGRGGAKGSLALRDQTLRARSLFKDIRSENMLRKTAIDEVAKALNITFSKARALILSKPK